MLPSVRKCKITMRQWSESYISLFILCFRHENKPWDLKKNSDGFRAFISMPLSFVPVYLVFIRSCL